MKSQKRHFIRPVEKMSFQIKELEDIPKEYDYYKKEAQEKLNDINLPMGSFITNSVMVSTILGLYYSVNDLLGFEPYLNGIGNKVDNFLTTSGFLSLLIIYKVQLKREKKFLKNRIIYCEKMEQESKKYIKSLKI